MLCALFRCLEGQAVMQSRCAGAIRRLELFPHCSLWRPRYGEEARPPAGGWTMASTPALWRRLRAGGASVMPGFLSEDEEALLARELEPQLRRRRYADEHWDGVGPQESPLDKDCGRKGLVEEPSCKEKTQAPRAF